MACWLGVDTKYDPDVLVIDLDPPHEGTDKVALGGPIGLVQPITDQACEGLQLADDEVPCAFRTVSAARVRSSIIRQEAMQRCHSIRGWTPA